ncbi:MAG: universal stress protein [Lewinellaceae bacterium]|nr:universal stress protein [Lewinellaceae bacterium]
MDSFPRILVALDLSPTDHLLIQHARKIAELFLATRVYFVHIIPDIALPKSAQLEFRKRFAPETPIDEQVQNQLEKTIAGYWESDHPTAWSVDVIEGQPYSQLLHWLEVKKIDLLVVGQKQKSSGFGITARKLANQAPCSVLFVPEVEPPEGQRLLIPVDFSKDSAKALRLALNWGMRREGVEITALHVTDLIAAGYYLNRQEFENFNRFLADTAKDSFQHFLDEYEFPADALTIEILRNDERSISDCILEFAATEKADWIILGAQGHGAIERFFFGSVTEKLVSQPLPVPTLVVRA